jgi:hypothetical protein
MSDAEDQTQKHGLRRETLSLVSAVIGGVMTGILALATAQVQSVHEDRRLEHSLRQQDEGRLKENMREVYSSYIVATQRFDTITAVTAMDLSGDLAPPDFISILTDRTGLEKQSPVSAMRSLEVAHVSVQLLGSPRAVICAEAITAVAASLVTHLDALNVKPTQQELLEFLEIFTLLQQSTKGFIDRARLDIGTQELFTTPVPTPTYRIPRPSISRAPRPPSLSLMRKVRMC